MRNIYGGNPPAENPDEYPKKVACNGKNIGDDCSFIWGNEEVTRHGTCKFIHYDLIICSDLL